MTLAISVTVLYLCHLVISPLFCQVVGFASDERERLGKPVDYADVYHSASRYSTGRGNFPIVLPRTIGWTFLRQRLVLGRELMMFQGHSVSADCDLTEAQLGNMAGNAWLGCLGPKGNNVFPRQCCFKQL